MGGYNIIHVHVICEERGSGVSQFSALLDAADVLIMTDPFMLSGLFYHNSLEWSFSNNRVSGQF